MTNRLNFFSLVAAFSAALLLTVGTPNFSFAAEEEEQETPAPKERELTVMAYNMRVGVGIGPRNDADIKENLRAIAELIRDHEADLVLLQEVDQNTPRTDNIKQAEFLAEATGHHVVFAPAIDYPPGKYGIALLSRWPIAQHEVTKLFQPDYSDRDLPDWYAEQRVALTAGIDSPMGKLTVINTHMGLTPGQRQKQLEQVAGLIEAEKDAPLIFGGDLNAEPDATELLPIRRQLRDCYHKVRKSDAGITTNIPIRERLTFPSDEPNRCIDYLFVTEDFEVKKTEVIDSQLSDHRPVITHLRLEQGSE